MKILKITLCLGLLTLAGSADVLAQGTSGVRQSQSAMRNYSGGWFDVRYPASFTARGSIVTTSGETGKFDSARFTSPDGKVTFYVYAPQWRGDPTDIDLGPDEREGSREVKRTKKNTVTFWTIVARNGATRSYQKTEEHASNTSWVVGIEYADQASYQRYRQQYLQFKQSLRLHAD